MKKKILKIILISFLLIFLLPFIVNFYVIISTSKNIYSESEVQDKYDIALVLGCGIKNNEPSLMLRDRLNTAINLYNNEIIDTILISGDHHEGYSEVDVMEKYLLENNIPKYSIIRDNNGFSTRESLINYQKDFSNQKVIIITQKYHMYRALNIANKLEINAIGVHAKLVRYPNQTIRDIREILARNKDFFLN